MSWSCSTVKPVKKEMAEKTIDGLRPSQGIIEGPVFDQLFAAKRAAKELLKSVPGPYVQVTLSGHANGIGWQKDKVYANDCITVSVTQFCEDDLK